jgi:hypothetical protein
MGEDVPGEVQIPEEISKPIAEQARAQFRLLREAAEIIVGERPETEDEHSETEEERSPIVKAFDPPNPDRAKAPMPDWTKDQITKVREKARQLGYGAEKDVASGLTGGVRIAEGGKIWKIMAEAVAIKGEEGATHLIFAGSPDRTLGEDELTFLRDKQDVELPEGTTEYDAARWVAERQVSAPEETALPFGYDVAEGNHASFEQTGQFLGLGQTAAGQEVTLLRVDREIYTDEAGDKKYRYQPDTARIMGIVSETIQAGEPDAPTVLVTSNTYASRQVDAVRAGLKSGRQYGVAMYGRKTLIELNASVPAETPINQLPGDLRSMYDKLQLLQTELGVSLDSTASEE